MSSPWSATVDRALRTTNETLERLQRAEVSYEHARTRLFPDGQSPLQKRGVTGSSRVEVPLPLPHSRYVPVAARPPSSPPAFADKSGLDADRLTLADVIQSHNLLRSQMHTLVAELALERVARTDSINDVRTLYQNQMAMLTSSLGQLKDENEHLRRSVRALETRQAYHRGARCGVNESGQTSELARPPMYSALTAGSAEGKSFAVSGFADGSQLAGGSGDALVDAKMHFLNHAPAVAELKQRVGALEIAMSSQKDRLDGRQDRTQAAIADLVKTQVAVEVERVRSVAREAARDATEELVRLRLTAIQSMFNAELQKVLESTGVTQEVSAATEKQFRRLEREWEGRLTRVEGSCRAVQEQTSDLHKLREDARSAQAALRQDMHTTQAEVSAVKRQVEEATLRQTQFVNNKVDGCRAETMVAVTQLLDDRERHRLASASSAVSETEVRRLLESTTAPMQQAIDHLQTAAQRERDRADTTAHDLARRLAAVEAAQRSQHDALDSLQNSVAKGGDEHREVRARVDSLQQGQHAAQTALHDLTGRVNDTAASVQALEQRIDSDRQVDADAFRDRQRDHNTRLAELQRRQAESAQSTAALVDDLASTVTTLQQEQRRTIGPLQAQLNALKTALDDGSVKPLDELRLTVSALATQQKQLQESKNYQDRITAQQLSDINAELGRRVAEVEASARRYSDEVGAGHAHNHDILAQRVSNLEKAVQRTDEENRWNAMEDRAAALEERPSPAVVPVPHERAERDEALSAKPATVDASEINAVRDTVALLATRVDRYDDVQGQSHNAVHALEASLADVRRSLTTVQEGLQRVEAAAQQQRGEWRGPLEQQAAFAREQMAALNDHVVALMKESAAASQSNIARVRDSLAPARLVASFSTTEDALEALAALLEPHLASVGELAQKVGTLQSSLKKVLAEAERARKQADDEPTEAAAAAGRVPTEVLTDRLADLERGLAALRTAVDGHMQLVTDTQTADRDACASLVKRIDETVSEQAQTVGEVAREQKALVTGQRTLLNTVQERLQAVEDALREAQEAALQPLRIKVRGAEDSLAGLQGAVETLRTQLESTNGTCLQRHEQGRQALSQLTASTSAARDELCKTLLDSLQERYGLLKEQLDDHERRQHDELQRLHADLESRLEHFAKQASLAGTVAPDGVGMNLSDILDPIDEQLQQLQSQVDAALRLRDGSATSTDAASGTAATALAVDDLAERLATVEVRLAELKESEDAGLQVTADALGSLSDSLQQCVGRVREEMKRSPLWSNAITPRDSTDNSGESAAVGTGTPQHTVQALDDVFVFVVRQLQHVFHALSALQESTISSLEMIQQQELDVLAVAPLQQAVLDLVRRLEPVARAVGVDPATLHVDVGPLVHSLEDVSDAPVDGTTDVSSVA